MNDLVLIVLYCNGKGVQTWCGYAGGTKEADTEGELMSRDGYVEKGRFFVQEKTQYVPVPT